MNDKNERTPILEPVLMLLKSRRFVTAVVTALISWLITTLPALESQKETLITAIVMLGSVLIGGFSAEDFGAQMAKKDK